jgi:hypothetical protein
MRLDKVARLDNHYCKIVTVRGEELFGRLTRLSHDAFELIEPIDERAVAWFYAGEVASADSLEPPHR